MDEEALRQLWQQVTADLARARSHLPPVTIGGGVHFPQFEEFLDHNELELALDELEELGTLNVVPPEFWQALLAAAEKMGLTQHSARLAARIVRPK